jgi:hypothetical protein
MRTSPGRGGSDRSLVGNSAEQSASPKSLLDAGNIARVEYERLTARPWHDRRDSPAQVLTPPNPDSMLATKQTHVS